MATRLYGANVGYNLESVTEQAGSATTAHSIELTVDMATLVNDGGATRTIRKSELLIILNLFYQYIERETAWPGQ